jgi:hypothetical protein
MTQKGKANGSFFGNFLYEQILSQRPHFLQDLAQGWIFALSMRTGRASRPIGGETPGTRC